MGEGQNIVRVRQWDRNKARLSRLDLQPLAGLRLRPPKFKHIEVEHGGIIRLGSNSQLP